MYFPTEHRWTDARTHVCPYGREPILFCWARYFLIPQKFFGVHLMPEHPTLPLFLLRDAQTSIYCEKAPPPSGLVGGSHACSQAVLDGHSHSAATCHSLCSTAESEWGCIFNATDTAKLLGPLRPQDLVNCMPGQRHRQSAGGQPAVTEEVSGRHCPGALIPQASETTLGASKCRALYWAAVSRTYWIPI